MEFEKGTGQMYCRDARSTLFDGFEDEEAEMWMGAMQCQPAEGWADVVTYGGWKDVPSVYVVAKEDKALPAEMQRQMAEMAGIEEVVSVRSGHMVMLSQPEKCLEVILKAAASG
jgi:pimeloyl-ACP methyl ester carboxylesterase